jgi:hypothetical protein
MNDLVNNPLECIKVNMTLQISRSIVQDQGVHLCKLSLSSGTCPWDRSATNTIKIFSFLTKIFNTNVEENREICVNTLKKMV